MVIKTSIFSLDTTYISNKKTQEEVFEEVYLDLLKKKLVTPDFLTNLLEREHNYPTGLSLTPIDPALPNTDRSSLLAFFQYEDKEEVYRFLQKNFKGEI